MAEETDLELKYKTPIKKLAKFFNNSRDKWKQRALNNSKRIEHLEKKIRDVKRSRDKWKQEAKKLKTSTQNNCGNDCENKPLEGELILAEKTDDKTLVRAKAHLYSLQAMILGIQFIIFAHNSLRGAMQIFKLMGSYFHIETPSWVTIQNWLLRVGLYNLQKCVEHRDDWIYILDNTVQIGTKKALVILGVTREHLKSAGYSLNHTDVCVLEIFPSDKINGEIVHQKIKDVASRTGNPMQIVADKGPDVNLGIKSYRATHTDTIYTYDITHKTANMLKKLLEKDPCWKSFQTECGKLKKRVQQTELAHLSPPKQRTKSRYLNISPLVSWAENILLFKERNNFSSIKSTYQISKSAMKKFAFMSKKKKALLEGLEGIHYKDENDFLSDVRNLVGARCTKSISAKLLKHTNISKVRFSHYFNWITSYGGSVKKYAKIVCIIEIINKEVKNNGIHCKTAKECQEKIRKIRSRCRDVGVFKEEIIQHLKVEGKGIRKAQALLGTSDIIESIFGKYKMLDSNSTIKGIGKMILSIPVFTAKLTLSFIKEAIENVKQKDVESWINKFLGKSVPASRLAAFNESKK